MKVKILTKRRLLNIPSVSKIETPKAGMQVGWVQGDRG